MDAFLAPSWHLERNLEMPGKALHHIQVLARLEDCTVGLEISSLKTACSVAVYFLLCLPMIYRWSPFTLLTCAFLKKGKLTKVLCMLCII